MLTEKRVEELEKFATDIRIQTIRQMKTRGFGHMGGAMSICDLLSVLYGEQMKYDADNPEWEERDWLICSKGHAGPAVYAALALKGFFPMDWLDTLNQPETRLPSHCDHSKTPGIDVTTGSLGQGLACAVGMALAGKMNHKDYKVFSVVGDGEAQEGEIWEAANTAHKYQLDNLIVFMDYNGLQIDGPCDQVMPNRDLGEKFRAFGFEVIEIDGHNMEEICATLEKCYASKNGKPKCIYAHTIKGKGVSFMENSVSWHGVAPNEEEHAKAMQELQAQIIE